MGDRRVIKNGICWWDGVWMRKGELKFLVALY